MSLRTTTLALVATLLLALPATAASAGQVSTTQAPAQRGECTARAWIGNFTTNPAAGPDYVEVSRNSAVQCVHRHVALQVRSRTTYHRHAISPTTTIDSYRHTCKNAYKCRVLPPPVTHSPSDGTYCQITTYRTSDGAIHGSRKVCKYYAG